MPYSVQLDQQPQQTQSSGGYSVTLDPQNPESQEEPRNPLQMNLQGPTDFGKGGGAETALVGGIGKGAINTIGQAVGAQPVTGSSGVEQAMSDNPNAALAGKVIGGGAVAAGLTLATAGGLTLAGAGEALTAYGANMIAGSVLAGPGNRTFGAVTGLVAKPAGDIIGAGAKYLTSALSIDTLFSKAIADVNSKITGTPDKVAALGLSNTYDAAKATEKGLVAEMKDTNLTTVPINASNKAAEILAKYNNPKTLGHLNADQESTLKQIVDWSKQTQGKSEWNPVDGGSTAPATPPTKFSFSELHDTRKGLDQLIRQAEAQSGKGEISSGIYRDLISLRDPLEKDLQTAASSAGKLGEYTKLNDFYKNTILPLNDGGVDSLSAAMKQAQQTKTPFNTAAEVDKLINRNINVNQPEKAKAFLSILDPSTRQASEVQIINNSVKSATSRAGNLSLPVFKQSIQGVQKAIPGVFSDDTNLMLNGLNKSIDEATTLGGIKLDLSKLSMGGKLASLAGVGAGAGAMAHAGGAAALTSLGTGVIGTAIAASLHSMIQSKVGQQLLIQAGTETGRTIAKSITNGLTINALMFGGQGYMNQQPQGQ